MVAYINALFFMFCQRALIFFFYPNADEKQFELKRKMKNCVSCFCSAFYRHKEKGNHAQQHHKNHTKRYADSIN